MFNTTESKLDLLIPAFSGDVKGTYNLSCVFDSNTTLILENSIVIYQYLQLTDISPSTMTIGQQIKVSFFDGKFILWNATFHLQFSKT